MKIIINALRISCILCPVLSVFAEAPLVYDGESGLGKGKHLVFIASDHEYRSEETLPALARILAKHHGFKCSVVFGVNAKVRSNREPITFLGSRSWTRPT